MIQKEEKVLILELTKDDLSFDAMATDPNHCKQLERLVNSDLK